MVDRYEEFKEWFRNQTDISWRATGCHFIDYDDELPFSKFEHEQEEKQKEIIIKRRIGELVYENVTGRNKNICISVDGIYDGLKDMGLLND
mgnify:CR=1 FL=1